jgi:hypothetical protein
MQEGTLSVRKRRKIIIMRRGYGIWVVLALLWIMSFGIAAQETLEQVRFDVEPFEITGNNPIGERANEVLGPYIGEQYGLEGLSAARAALEQAIIDAGGVILLVE